MADFKISGLGELTTHAGGDKIPIVDVSDLTQAASGTTKWISITNLFAGASNGIYGGAGTVPSATVATLTDYINYTGGKIGIGIVPTAKLHLKGDGNAGSTVLTRFQNSDDSGSFQVSDQGVINAISNLNGAGLSIKNKNGTNNTKSFEVLGGTRNVWIMQETSATPVNNVLYLSENQTSYFNSASAVGFHIGQETFTGVNPKLSAKGQTGMPAFATLSLNGTSSVMDDVEGKTGFGIITSLQAKVHIVSDDTDDALRCDTNSKTSAFVVHDEGYPVAANYTVATAPVVHSAGGYIYVSDETGGATLAFSDGTNWRRTTDLTIIA